MGMATLILTANPAERNGAFVSINLSLCERSPFPTKQVEIKKAQDAVTAMDAYAAEIAAMGKGAACWARLKKGDRAPNGFKALKLEAYVNV
jgi:hypothetical protein